jgi:uncharacterized protein YjbI with pentapeptide repeats
LAVGWKLTSVTGRTHGDYYWPLVDGDHDLLVLHRATAWDDRNRESCPAIKGDGLCLVTTSVREASSGGVHLTSSTGHVLVYPADLARSDTDGKYRVPWCIDVDAFDPVAVIRGGMVANLSRADLSRADLSGADLSGADLSRAILSRAILSGAILSGADLSRANLSKADLSGADLSGADLSGADLSGADLYGADLYGANLSRADLSRADLYGADLGRWKRDDATGMAVRA